MSSNEKNYLSHRKIFATAILRVFILVTFLFAAMLILKSNFFYQFALYLKKIAFSSIDILDSTQYYNKPPQTPDCLFVYRENCLPEIILSPDSDQITLGTRIDDSDNKSWRKHILALMLEQVPLLLAFQPQNPNQKSILDVIIDTAKQYDINPIIISFFFWKKTSSTIPEWDLFATLPQGISQEINEYENIYNIPFKVNFSVSDADANIAKLITSGNTKQRAVRHYCLKHFPDECESLWQLLTSQRDSLTNRSLAVYQISNGNILYEPQFITCFNKQAHVCGLKLERIVCAPYTKFFVNCGDDLL